MRNTDRIPKATARTRSFYTGSTVMDGHTDDELELLRAIQTYKREERRPFPAWTEFLAIVLSLGYRKVAVPGPLPTFRKGKS